jgi:hypothetical protein
LARLLGKICPEPAKRQTAKAGFRILIPTETSNRRLVNGDVSVIAIPQVYDKKMNPGEIRTLWGAEGYAHLWVTKLVMDILISLPGSMREYPNTKPGQDWWCNVFSVNS